MIKRLVELVRKNPKSAAAIAAAVAGALGFGIPAWVWPVAAALLGVGN